MIQFACRCLNIILEVTNCPTYNIELIKAKNEEDIFFSKDPRKFECQRMIIKIPSLICTRLVDNAIIHFCVNCCLDIYAKEKLNSKFIWMHSEYLASADDICNLKKHPNYSEIFQVIISCEEATGAPDNDLDEYLEKIVTNWISSQNALIEEKIQEFTEKQFELLEELKSRAKKEKLVLSKRLPSSENVKRIPMQQITKYDKNNCQPASLLVPSPIGVRRRSTSFDAEEVFMFDDIGSSGNATAQSDYSPEGSDDELKENRSGATVGSTRNGKNSANTGPVLVPRHGASSTLPVPGITRSVPVPIPSFMQRQEIGFSKSQSPEVPVDIAESIKALAKSVHGDTVFGELPRSRFRTKH